MKCEVLLFAELAERVGRDRLALKLDAGATVGDALDRLSGQEPGIRTARSTLAVAVNERYCDHGTPLSDGDTIALIPPVSGG